MTKELTIIRIDERNFTIRAGDKFSTHLCFDEALGVAAQFILNGAGNLQYLKDYPDWASNEKRWGGYVTPAALLPAPGGIQVSNVSKARELVTEALGVSCPAIRVTYLERIKEALG
ncbi:MAG: hypothetical protein LCH90_19295 [Proteobacteria bacterium]|nr:hypothetical protein [Pseudomonadota bacterium]